MHPHAYRWLIKQAKPAHRWLFLSTMLGIASGIGVIFQSWLIASIIDHLALHHATLTQLSSSLIALFVVILLRPCVTALREIISFKAAQCIKETVRAQCLEHLIQLTPQQLSSQKTGALTSALIEQIEALHGFFADYFPQMVIAVLLPLIILSIVFSQNWVAGCVLLITAPLIPLFMALIGMGTAKLNQENFQTLSRMSAHFLDRLQGLTTLALFNRARDQLKSIETISNEFREKTMCILRIAFLSTAALELFGTLSIAIIAVYLGLGLLGLIHAGFGVMPIQLKTALFILLLAPEFFMPLRQLGVFYHARAQAIGAASEIIQLIESHSIKKPAHTMQSFFEKRIAFTFHHVEFSYTEHQKILNDFNAMINPNECIVIIGPSGSGKSTLLHLIAKLITPQVGEIRANQININQINDDQWREHISLLHQHPRLFHGTIINNIRFAKPDATDDEIHCAADDAGVLHFAEHFSHGMHTLIGEENAGLSGGQTQRVALSRIILKNTPIILLDEPTAHLDQSNVAIITTLLEKWYGNKTVLIATHDERLLAYADRVIEVGVEVGADA